jgi:hypothetical protein
MRNEELINRKRDQLDILIEFLSQPEEFMNWIVYSVSSSNKNVFIVDPRTIRKAIMALATILKHEVDILELGEEQVKIMCL